MHWCVFHLIWVLGARGVVVVGLKESHLLWYGLEHGLDPPSLPLYHRLVVGVENGHSFSFGENL